MPAPVVQHICDRVACIVRGLDLFGLVPKREHFARAHECFVERARRANRKALHAAAKCFLVVRLDDEMQVIALSRWRKRGTDGSVRSITCTGCAWCRSGRFACGESYLNSSDFLRLA